MKKILLTIVLFIVIACAPTPTATAQDSQTEMTTEPSQINYHRDVASITIKYQTLGNIPDGWLVDYTPRENLKFTRSESGWDTVSSQIKIKELGELYPDLILKPLSNGNGDCPINTYFEKSTDDLYQISYQPLCSDPNPEEIATMTFGFHNCDMKENGDLVCTKESPEDVDQGKFDMGVLHYTLNKDQTSLTFSFTGAWCDDFEIWIASSAKALGFTIPDGFFDHEFKHGLDVKYSLVK